MWVGGSSDDFDNEAAESMVLVLVEAIRLVGGSSRLSGERRRERKRGKEEGEEAGKGGGRGSLVKLKGTCSSRVDIGCVTVNG